jgi:peptidase A4-like protein
VSLALVQFNGTLYPNGSVLPPLITGYNYTFAAVDLAQGYDMGQWALSSGGITGGISSASTTIYFGCVPYIPPCPGVNLSLSVAARDHSLMSGNAYHASVVRSMSATFTVPSLTWFFLKTNRTPPPANASQLADWGIGLGGVISSPAIVVGLQLNWTSQGGNRFTAVYTPFWSTSIKSRVGQLNFASSVKAAPGDVVGVSLTTSTCAGQVVIQIYDLSLRNPWTYGTTYGSCPGSFLASTGQWMVWNPLNASGTLSPIYQFGEFTNLDFSGQPVYATSRTPGNLCSPWTACAPPRFPPVVFSQWANAKGGWNESLTQGSFSYVNYNATFLPAVSTLANVAVSIFPYDLVQASDSLQVLVDGGLYTNGESTNLPIAALAPINATPLPAIGNGLSLYFAQWNTTAGIVTSASAQATTLNVSQPGRLEGLTRGIGPAWGGYVNATDYRTTHSVSGTFNVPLTQFNYTALNRSLHNLTGPLAGYPWEDLSLWVGLGGSIAVKFGGAKGPYLWQAGIDISYSNNSTQPHGFPPVLAITPWYEYIAPSCLNSGGCPTVTGPSTYRISPGNVINATVSVCGPPSCSSWSDSWTIVDFNQQPYPGQPIGNGPFENWSGTLSGNLPVDTNTSEWIAEAESSPACNQYASGLLITQTCILPTVENGNYSLSFSNLWINRKPVDLFGPFQLADANHLHPGKPTYIQLLIAAPEVGKSISSFWIREY